MSWMNLFLYMLVAIVTIFVVYLFVKNIELAICAGRRNVPFVPSANIMRRAVADEIRTHYPNAKTVCDIGSGYGGLTRHVARDVGIKCVGLENMPFTAAVGYILDCISGTDSKTIWCDAFRYLDSGVRFDIGVAYLGPWVNNGLTAFSKNFDVLITLDVPVARLTPVRVIDIEHGYTRYGRTKYPHKLFVYEF